MLDDVGSNLIFHDILIESAYTYYGLACQLLKLLFELSVDFCYITCICFEWIFVKLMLMDVILSLSLRAMLCVVSYLNVT